MDKIILEQMAFFAHHGVTPEERETGQWFEVDAQMHLDTRAAAAADDLAKTVDYDLIYRQISEIILSERFCLLETLAERIAGRILSNQVVEKATIRVKKVKPPIDGKLGGVAVEITRGR